MTRPKDAAGKSTARAAGPKPSAATPPAEVREKGLCGPNSAHLFPGVRVRDLLSSDNAKKQRLGIRIACSKPCPVRSTCLLWAVVTDQEHVAWGGQTPRQLKALQRRYKARRGAEAAARAASAASSAT